MDISLESDNNEPNEEFPEFFFETDHLALKGNDDYLNMLKTLAILEAQKIQGIKDIDYLMEIHEMISEDPISFVKKLQKGEEFQVPPPQNVPEVPEINWSKYGMSIPEQMKTVINKDNEISTSKLLIRGRKFDDNKPETFNQLWTTDEQRRLEELLIEYPPEEVETNRWKKIAAALGNRTAKQVGSRVQKYFQKLHKAGLAVPGRAPKRRCVDFYNKKRNYAHKHQKYNHFLFKPTTFFPSRDIPVAMTDCDDKSLEKFKEESSSDENEDSSDKKEENLTILQLDLLRRVKKDKELINNFKHIGYKCDFCKEDPIFGTRWHCMECLTKSVDFCNNCVIAQLESENPHPMKHYLRAIRNEEIAYEKSIIWDKDYLPPSFSDNRETSYNYLDPNFMPS